MQTEEEVTSSGASSEDTSSTNVDEAIIEKIVAERLSKMNDNMDKMSAERDKAIKKATELESAAKKAQIERLESEGKTTEAAQLEIAELKARLEVLTQENTTLSRDHVVSNATTGLDFRNETAKDMAIKEITSQLIQDDNGQWKHKTGISIKEFVDVYSKDKEKEFLFKPKTSSGSATMQAGTPSGSSSGSKKKVTEMSTQELLRAAASGDFGEFPTINI